MMVTMVIMIGITDLYSQVSSNWLKRRRCYCVYGGCLVRASVCSGFCMALLGGW